MPRIGFMGGTFDPVHFAHLECALRAQEQLGLDEVLFVPAGNPSFKRDRKLASAEDRLEMCRLACAGNDSFKVSDMECRRDGITYSIDTIDEMLEGPAAGADIYFIVGSDAYLTLPKWKRFDELKELVRFAVLMRPGDDVEAVDGVTDAHGIDAIRIDCPGLDISSSYLRDTVRSGRSIRYLTPDAVCDYIERNGLYAD